MKLNVLTTNLSFKTQAFSSDALVAPLQLLQQMFPHLLPGIFRMFIHSSLRAVFHQVEFSARNDIFCRLLMLTLRKLVFKQRKMSLRAENSAWWKMAFKQRKMSLRAENSAWWKMALITASSSKTFCGC